jgi:hypothetical protein
VKRKTEAELRQCEGLLTMQLWRREKAFLETEQGSEAEARAMRQTNKLRSWVLSVRAELDRRDRLAMRKAVRS